MPAYKLANQNHTGYALKTKQGQRTKIYETKSKSNLCIAE